MLAAVNHVHVLRSDDGVIPSGMPKVACVEASCLDVVTRCRQVVEPVVVEDSDVEYERKLHGQVFALSASGVTSVAR